MTTYTLEREDTGQELTAYQIRDEVARLDGAATDTRWKPGDPWVPKDPYASMRCACGKVHESALIAPTAEELAAEGSTIAEEMTRGVDRKPGWPTWLGEIHHADAEWADIVARLRAMPDKYVAPPIERTVVEPVQVDYSYQQSEAWLWAEMVRGQSRQREQPGEYGGHVYDEDEGFKTVEADVPPDDRIDRMIDDPEQYFAEARERARSEVQAERQPEGREGLDRMVKRVPTVISAQHPQRETKGDVTLADYVNAIEAAEAVGVKIHPDPKPAPEGTVRASRWARLVAAIGGATTRRRQTEQDESEYDDTALPRQVGVAIGLTLGFFLAFMGVAWIVGVL